jgi:3-oxoacyl-[acyl-carrier protein] reductase
MITADLSGKRVLVTGGASGIGLAIATMVARSGGMVAINHLADDPRGATAVAALCAAGGKAIAVPGDVSSRAGAEHLVAAAIAALGGLDHLVNNAGTSGVAKPLAVQDLDAVTDELWEAVLTTNLLGTFHCSRAAAAALKASHGGITSIASVAGINQPGSSMAYGATKAGVISLTKNLARALAPEVRVNAIAPGQVITPWTEAWPEARKRLAEERALLKRRCTPEDIAEAALFLIAGGAMITAQVIVVDGGTVF